MSTTVAGCATIPILAFSKNLPASRDALAASANLS
jgi:hypothetical protein